LMWGISLFFKKNKINYVLSALLFFFFFFAYFCG
jgi:hypothetical protein